MEPVECVLGGRPELGEVKMEKRDDDCFSWDEWAAEELNRDDFASVVHVIVLVTGS